jgi:predicted transcriptional regulator
MEALWKGGPATAEAIIGSIAPVQGWEPTTVKTLLNRLLNKGAVKAERDGRRYIYKPALTRADHVFEESKNLVDRLFGGKIAPLVSQFSEEDRLSAEDIAELRRLVERLDNGT